MTVVMDTIAREARQSQTVMLTAAESDGTIETREIEPYSIRPGAPGNPDLLFGYCYEREAIRSWHLPNLIAADPTGHSFVPRWPVEL